MLWLAYVHVAVHEDHMKLVCVYTIMWFIFLPLMTCSAIEQFARKGQDLNLQKEDGFAAIHLASLNDHLDVTTALADTVSSSQTSALVTTYINVHL